MTDFLKAFFIDTDYRLKNFFLQFIRKLLFSERAVPREIKRIIVFRTGSIGDSICALPALSVIRTNFPSAAIDLLTNAGSAHHLSLDKLIDTSRFGKIINYYGFSPGELHKEIKAGNYDLFIDLTQYDASLFKQLKTMVFAYTAGIKSGFGWQVSQTLLFKKYQEINRIFPNERDRLLSVLKKNHLNISAPFFISAQDPAAHRRVAKAMSGIRENGRLASIGLVPGSKLERNKWPLAFFKEVLDDFVSRNFNVIIFGGEEDREKTSAGLTGEYVFNFCGRFSPLETAEAMKACSLVITNDTGPMHLAYMVKTPVVAIFSSRDFPGKWYPPEDAKNKVFRSDNIACSICFGNACLDNSCMKRTTPEMVIEAAMNIIKNSG
jgi:ADP-heptose:LPS heptosyltransferase